MMNNNKQLMKLIQETGFCGRRDLVERAMSELYDLICSSYTPPAVKAKLILFVLENGLEKEVEEGEEQQFSRPPAPASLRSRPEPSCRVLRQGSASR